MDPASHRINAVIGRYYDISKPTNEFKHAIGSFVSQTERTLSERLEEDIRLDIFGSLKSGFGSLHSDIDVCLRFKSKKQPEDVRIKKVMRTVAKTLQKKKSVKSALPIMHAKVPIVKCEILKPLEISMDISYYNTLALENTRLLATYCTWEPERLPQLGLWVKKWAKEGGICDASMGYLSSYGCILLLVHYLQNCDPPVLPRLQEDYDQEERTHHSSGWNAYFYPIVKPGWSQNKKSVGELFLGFLEYYAKDFDFKENIVQIRQKKEIKKTEKKGKHKNWHGQKAVLAIEDPFELDRNLCGGLITSHFKRIHMYFERSAEALRMAIESVDTAADDEDFKRQLNEVLKKCHVSSEEIQKKGKKDEAEDVKENGPVKNANQNRAQRAKDAGAPGIRKTRYQRAAIDEMGALLDAMCLQKEDFPALYKKGFKRDTRKNPAAEFWKKKPNNDWNNVSSAVKQFNKRPEQQKFSHGQLKKTISQAKVQRNGPFLIKEKPAPPSQDPPRPWEKTKAIREAQALKNCAAKKRRQERAERKKALLEAQAQKNCDASEMTPQDAQTKKANTVAPPPQLNLSKVQRKALKKMQAAKNGPPPHQKKPAPAQAQNGTVQKPMPQKNQQQQKKNSQMVAPPQQQKLSKAQRNALNKIQAEKNEPPPQQKKPTPPQTQNGSVQNPVPQQKKKKKQQNSKKKSSPQDPSNVSSAPQPQGSSGGGKRKKKKTAAATASNPTPAAPTTASTK